MNKEEIVVETAKNLNDNLVIEKEIVDDRREQHDPDLLVMENSGKNSVRDLCDGLHLEKNNNL